MPSNVSKLHNELLEQKVAPISVGESTLLDRRDFNLISVNKLKCVVSWWSFGKGSKLSYYMKEKPGGMLYLNRTR